MKLFYVLFLIIISISNLFSKDTQKLTLQLDWLNQFQFAGYYIAKEKGFYKENNLDVTIKEFKNKTNLIKSVLENNNTYAIGKSSLIIDKLNNKNIILLAAIFQTSPLSLMSLKKSNINNINDLKNKKVMITPSARNSASLKAMIKSQGLSLDDIDFIPHSLNINDLINGKTDAIACNLSNEPYILKNKNIEFNLFNPIDYGFDFYSGILFTSSKELNTNPQRARDFYDASIKGWNYAFSNIEESAKIIYEKYNTQNKTLDSLIYEGKILKTFAYKNNPKYLGYINPSKINELKRLYLILGLAHNSKINLDNFIFDEKKVILSYLESKFLKDNTFALMTSTKNIPFSFKKENTVKGIEFDLFKLISKRMGITYNIIEKPKNLSIFKYIKTNDIYFEFNYSKDLLDLDKMIYSNSIFNIPIALATSNDKNFITDLSILSGKKIAILKNSDIYHKLKSKYKDINYIPIKTKEEGFKLLKNKKVFGYIDNVLSLSHTIIKEKLPNIKISGTVPFNLEMRIATNKENFLLINIINKIIPYLKKEEKEEILKQYQLTLINQIDDYSWIYKYILPLLLVLIIISIFNNRMRKEIFKRKQAEKDLKDSANRDSLTCIYNRGKIDKLIELQIKNSKISKEMFSIIFFDIDNFKQINDTFGHNKGDSVLIEMTSLISKNIRETDILGRWGGEEFIIILPKTTSDKAFILADNLRELISKNDFNLNKHITISLGIAQYTKKDTKEDLIQRADEAMYYIKTRGKNAVKIL